MLYIRNLLITIGYFFINNIVYITILITFVVFILVYDVDSLLKIWGLSGDLEIALFTSVIISVLLFFISKHIQAHSDFEKARKELINFYRDIVIPNIKLSFERSIDAINLNTYKNKLFYFDNSHINNLYSTICAFNKDISDLYKYDSSVDLAPDLLKFKLLVESAYIKAESMDILLERIYLHHNRNMVDPSVSLEFKNTAINNALLYEKAKYFAGFSSKILHHYFNHDSGGFISNTYAARSLVDTTAHELFSEYLIKRDTLLLDRQKLIDISSFIRESLLKYPQN